MAASEVPESCCQENSQDTDDMDLLEDPEMLALDAEAPESIFPGARLSNEKCFTHKSEKIGLTPVILEFRRIMKNTSHSNVIPGVSY